MTLAQVDHSFAIELYARKGANLHRNKTPPYISPLEMHWHLTHPITGDRLLHKHSCIGSLERLKSVTLFEIDKDTQNRLAHVKEFRENTDYDKLEVIPTLAYMNKMYLDTVARHIDISQARLCDCGAGFGWLAFAFLLRGGKEAVIVEPNRKKLSAARQFAEILGLSDRCEFRSDFLQAIDLPDKSVDIFASIETLEHVGKTNIVSALENIARLTVSVIVLTTPNKLSPLVSHDGKVPLAHWLPKRWRPRYVKLFGKNRKDFNDFAGPWHLKYLRRQFRPVTRTLTFESYQDWEDHYPVFSPYGGGRWKNKSPTKLGLYLRAIAILFGRSSYWVNPNLGSVWVRKS